MSEEILVIGGGLAGSEAAWQLAESGRDVCLVEMRPEASTQAHRGPHFAELVCSNSLRGDHLGNAVGLLKREMEELGSLIIRAARATAVPAGGALAVDRMNFPALVSEELENHPRIRIERREVNELPEGRAIIATGPLTSSGMHKALDAVLGEESLAFYDAIAPIVSDDSLDHDRLFRASRYDRGDHDAYLNAAMNREEYENFVAELVGAERVKLADFESGIKFFEGCLPIEVMADRGPETLSFGPMKPVGLIDPRTGHRPWAVVQLRRDDIQAEAWNLVGFQTKLTYSEQKRIFRLIPGLENAEFVRLGTVHRNTFINAPMHLDASLRIRACPHIRLAGQITGVEGYVESAAVGLLASYSLIAELQGLELPAPPPETAFGGLVRHLTASSVKDFQPSNITWGLIACPDEARKIRKKRDRRLHQAELALDSIRLWAESRA